MLRDTRGVGNVHMLPRQTKRTEIWGEEGEEVGWRSPMVLLVGDLGQGKVSWRDRVAHGKDLSLRYR